MDLRLDHPGAITEPLCHVASTGAVVADSPVRDGNPKPPEDLFRLIFVNIHPVPPIDSGYEMDIFGLSTRHKQHGAAEDKSSPPPRRPTCCNLQQLCRI
jgi:hypothetical protein